MFLKRVRLAVATMVVLVAEVVLAAGIGAVPPVSAATGPTRPGPVTVASVSQSGALIDFRRSTGVGRIRYRVFANGVVVATRWKASQVSVPLRCGRTYYVTVVAVDARGRRSKSAPGANLRTRACLDRTAPTAPGQLQIVERTDSTVSLTWSAATDRVGVTGYLVYRNGVVLGGTTTRSYQARNLKPATSYTFTVRARDRAGNLSPATTRVASTDRPVQSTGDVRAFVLTTDGESFTDAQRHYMHLDRVFPTFFTLTAAGDVTGTGQPVLTRWFQQRGVLVLPRFHTEDPAAIEAVVTDPVRRAHAAEQVAQVVSSAGYDGASLDLEMNMPTTGVNGLTVTERWDRLRNGYSDFVEEVSTKVQAGGGLVSVAVSPNWCSAVDPQTRQTTYCTDSASPSTRRRRAYLFDYERLAAAADEVWVMAWGLHWASSESGPVADIRWLDAVTDYYADLFAARPALADKLTLGTNLYAMDWSEYVVQVDRIAWPGTTFPTSPSCPDSSRPARARTSYEGPAGAGTLVIEWTCLTRYATTLEHKDVDVSNFETHTFDEESAEHVLSAPDPSHPGAQRILWYVDQVTIDRRAALATSAGWRIGFWRLGREDQSIWNLPVLTSGEQP